MEQMDDKSKNTITSLPIQNELRQTPLNNEAEKALLGALLTNNKAYEQVESFLGENAFSDQIKTKILSCLKNIIAKG